MNLQIFVHWWALMVKAYLHTCIWTMMESNSGSQQMKQQTCMLPSEDGLRLIEQWVSGHLLERRVGGHEKFTAKFRVCSSD